jgi:hypothetical protein
VENSQPRFFAAESFPRRGENVVNPPLGFSTFSWRQQLPQGFAPKPGGRFFRFFSTSYPVISLDRKRGGIMKY